MSRVVGFKKIKFYTNENVGSGELDLPEQQMHTTSYWLTIPSSVMGVLPYASDDRRDGVVGLAFALKQVAQLLLMCDGHDIGISIDSEETDGVRQRRDEPADDFRLRQLPGRHRLQRAAVPDARRAAVGHASAHRRVPVRERLPRMRRSRRQHRSAGESRGAPDPRSAAGRRRRGRSRPLSPPATRRSRRFELAGRSHSRDRGAPPESRCARVPKAPFVGGSFGPAVSIRTSNPDPRRRLASRTAAAASSSIAGGSRRRFTGASGLAGWRRGWRRLKARRRCSRAAPRRGRRSCSSISRPRGSAAAPAR